MTLIQVIGTFEGSFYSTLSLWFPCRETHAARGQSCPDFSALPNDVARCATSPLRSATRPPDRFPRHVPKPAAPSGSGASTPLHLRPGKRPSFLFPEEQETRGSPDTGLYSHCLFPEGRGLSPEVTPSPEASLAVHTEQCPRASVTYPAPVHAPTGKRGALGSSLLRPLAGWVSPALGAPQ